MQLLHTTVALDFGKKCRFLVKNSKNGIILVQLLHTTVALNKGNAMKQARRSNGVAMGLDTGFGTVVASRKIDGEPRSAAVASHSGLTRWDATTVQGVAKKSDPCTVVQIGDHYYAVGQNAPYWGDTGFGSMMYNQLVDDRYMAIVYAAWAKVIQAGESNIEIAIALPNEMLDGSADEDYRPVMKAKYAGAHAFAVDGVEYSLSVKVKAFVPQALCAFASVSDDEVDTDGMTAVATLGANTVEVFVVQDGKVIPRGVAGSRRAGVVRLGRSAFGQKIDWGQADRLVRAGKVPQTILAQWTEEVAAEIDAALAGLHIDTIVLCGGGALVRAERGRSTAGEMVAAKLPGNVVIHDNPVHGVAVGALELISG